MSPLYVPSLASCKLLSPEPYDDRLFPSAEDLDRCVETLEETGAISFLEGSWPTCYGPEIAEVGQKLPAREGFANAFLGENATRRTEHLGILFQAPRSQGDIPSDHDIILAHMLGNPIICRVELPIHNNYFEPVLLRGPHPRVRNQGDLEPIALCHTIDFLLHRAAISIDKDV